MSETKKTSDQWNKEFNIEIMDPDGWDRANFEYSWYQEPITLEEFKNRVTISTIYLNTIPKEWLIQ